MEVDVVAQVLRKLPVFVLEGLGPYYSAIQLKYATGTNAHVLTLYRFLRDAKRVGGRVREKNEAKTDKMVLKGSVPLGGKPQGAPPDKNLLRAIGYEGPLLGGGAPGEGSSSGGVMTVAAAAPELAVQPSEVFSTHRSPGELAKVVVRTAISLELPLKECMNRAVYQLEAAGGDHFALRQRFIQIWADSLNGVAPAPERQGEDSGEEASEPEKKDKGAASEPGGDELVEAYESEDDDMSVDLEAEDDDNLPRFLSEKEGRITYGEAPVHGLGDLGRGYWEDFEIPEELVMIQTNYNEELAERYLARNNLWRASMLAKILPITIPFGTPSEEVFFSEALVRTAIPGLSDHGSLLSLQALHVSFGAPVELTNHATTEQLAKLARLAGKRTAVDDDGLLNEEERALKKRLLAEHALLGERAKFEIAVAAIDYKRQLGE